MYLRAFTPEDRERIIALLLSAGHAERYPTVWRLQLLLDSRVWDLAHDVQLGEDDQGRLIACALLWKRGPDETVVALERLLHPDYAETDLPSALLDWAITRTTAEAARRGENMTLAVFPLEQDRDRLESQGFSRRTEDFNVYMKLALPHSAASVRLPPGFQLLPLAEEDLERYQAAYDFTAVSLQHQRELLRHPDYQHFVVQAPEGSLAAYLECSFWREEWAVCAQRVGWIDYVQTLPGFHRQGLAEALMLKGIDHLRAQGATSIMLITRSDNDSAQALFRKVGFSLAGEEYVYLKEIEPDAR
jgi:ribosomal protein S18 acetylase RimI-like enzyme